MPIDYDASNPFTRSLHPGMGEAVAARTVLRTLGDEYGNTYLESWGDVSDRVATGNALLHAPTFRAERQALRHHLRKATLLMSGRHLQHGDETQPERNLEVFSNCSTSATSFSLFMLLLNGSGVGRSYDDDMMAVNFNYAPNLRVVLDSAHKDFDWSQDESVRDARHKYQGDNVTWHECEDSREGWAKCVEIFETMAYQKVYVAHTLVLDFSKVRPRGAPIMGMQGRPSSGPKPLMGALAKIGSIKGSGMKPWKAALYADHYLAECVLVGGARRAARMSTKSWRDKDILDFIQVKRPIEYTGMTMDEVLEYRNTAAPFSYLWSSNNSVAVDADFWAGVREYQASAGVKVSKVAKAAWKVLTAVCEAAYGDGTGEPGLLNVDRLNRDDSGTQDLAGGDFVGSQKYTVEPDTRLLLSRLAGVVNGKTHNMIVNPCAEIPLLSLGGYCVIADLVPYHADTLDEAEDAFRVATRALIRTNLMDSLYAKETKRTNRIGVGVTGVHEFAWKFFQVGFRDMLAPDFESLRVDEPGFRAAQFWRTMRRFSDACKDEAAKYSAELGVNTPHTVTTVKPSGSVSKLFGLTEGWHLPAMQRYMRWVQFRSDDPLVQEYKSLGYQTRVLQTYEGTTIVGFPTQPAIGELDMGDALVTATQATPEEQYQWLHLGEEHWLGDKRAGQISYTLKYDPAKVSFEAFRDMLIEHQSVIKCCSVLPVTDSSAYEYLPESALTKGDYEEAMRAIAASTVAEDINFSHIDCGAGACPIDFNEEAK